MRIFRSAFEAGKAFPGCVAAVGKFDAMHRGHKRLLETAVAEAAKRRASCVVLTFDPSPEQYFAAASARPVLSLAERLALMRESDVDGVVLLPFDETLAWVSPEAFARDVLALQLRPSAVVVGADFCFGRDRAGRAETLQELGPGLGFEVVCVPLLTAGGEKITAGRVRDLLDRGETRRAERLLGRRL